MIWLARKAFFGHVPFPVLHVDTGKKFKEMYAFRDHYSKEWSLDLRVDPCPPLEQMDPTLPPATRSAARKTEGLKLALEKYGFDALVAGIRRDEEATRAKERVFSPRGLEGDWNVREQPPEFWDHFNATLPAGAHLRVHPILHWTELDIWAYTKREEFPSSRCTSRRTASATARSATRTSPSRWRRRPRPSTRSCVELADDQGAGALGARHGPRGRRLLRAASRRRLSVRAPMMSVNVTTLPLVRPDAADRPLVRIVIVGHVDHGKSTLIGRLLHETGGIPAAEDRPA